MITKWAMFLSGTILVFPGEGCKSGSEVHRGAGPINLSEPLINPLNLSADLLTFSRRFSAEVSGTASTIAAETRDRKAREFTLQWKLGAIPALRAVVADPDPRKAFVNTWLLCVRQRVRLEGPLGDVFGDKKALAVETTKALEKAIGEIGIQHFGKQTFVNAQSKAIAYAQESSFRQAAEGFSSIAAHDSPTAGDLMVGFISLPLAPISGLQGVGDTPGAINNFSTTARALGEMLQDMPEQIRWHTELVISELEHLDSVIQLREGIERTSKSFESLASTSEALPAQVRKEFNAALESFSASQEKIRPTIQETQKALASAEQAAQGIQRSAAELQKTAAAWESTVHAIEDLLKAYRELMPPRKEGPAGAGEPEKAEKGPTPEDITKIAVEIRTATLELRGLLDDIGSGKLSTAVSRIGETSNASIEHASGQMEKLIAWATMGGLILIAAALGAFMVYRRTAHR